MIFISSNIHKITYEAQQSKVERDYTPRNCPSDKGWCQTKGVIPLVGSDSPMDEYPGI